MAAPLARDIIESIRARRINYNPFVYGNPMWYGAVGDGLTDDTAAILACISDYTVTVLPVGVYYVTSTIAIPAGKALFGSGLISAVNPGSGPATNVGSVIIGALGLTPIVKCGSLTQVGGSIKGFSVFRSSGVPSSSSIGILINGGQAPIIEDVFSSGHGIPWYLGGPTVSGTGLGFELTRIFSGAAYDAHVVIDTIAECKFSQCRFGTNGTGDKNCNAYIRITGGNPAKIAAGPNTIVFGNCQFNQSTTLTNWIQFTNLAAPGVPTIDARVWLFSDSHIEGVNGALVKADSTWAAADRLGISNCNFNTSSADFFDLPATGFNINAWRFSNNWISAATFAPNVERVNDMAVVGNTFEGGCSVIYDSGTTSGWSMTSVGNTYAVGATCSLSGTKWVSGVFADSFNTASTFTNNGTPNASITCLNPGQSIVLWTPVLNFATAGTVIPTYTTQSGAMHVAGSQVTYMWRIILSNKGDYTGAASITGFPITHNSGLFQTGAVGVCVGNSNMAGLTAPMIAQGPVSAGAGKINLLVQNAAATAAISDANFTNTSDFSGSITFLL